MFGPSALGWSIADSAQGNASSMSSGVNLIAVCAVRNRSDTSCANRSSENAGSSKMTENVFTGESVRRAIRPTMALESIPPNRNAPNGTSDTT